MIAGAMVAAAILAALAVVYLVGVQDSNVTFWIGEDGMAGAEGQWIRTDSSQALPIHFEGGSELSLAPDASARMVRSFDSIAPTAISPEQWSRSVHLASLSE